VVKGQLAEPAGIVRISASIPTAQWSLSLLLPQLARDYPKIRVVLEVGDRFVDTVQERFDIVLRDHFAPLPDSGLVQRRLGIESNWLVASSEYLQVHGMPVRPADIATHNAVATSATASTWRLTN